jgi:hypothetical protein
MRLRTDLFSDKQIEFLMGNIEEIYDFQQSFFQLLKLSIDHLNPHQSLIGKCFLLFVRIIKTIELSHRSFFLFSRKKSLKNIPIIVSIIHYHV